MRLGRDGIAGLIGLATSLFLLPFSFGLPKLPIVPIGPGFYPALVLGYFAVMLPFKVVLHALILQHFSVIFMPVLYLCFGAIFDLMVFVALYSWITSQVPAEALRQ